MMEVTMAKQTSIELLFDWIEANMDEDNFDILLAKEKAIKMHKEEIKEAFYKGYDLRDEYGWSREHEDADEEYYQETYGGNNG